MADIKITHLLVGCAAVGTVAVVVLAFTGYVAVGWLNKENLNKLVDQGHQTVSGYTPAKTPTEAMDKFRDAIQSRKYKFAASYCTKPYAEQVERIADGATQLGEEIDRIERYADNKGIKSEKLAFFLRRLDPFPKNFKTGPAPKEDDKDKSKASGVFVVEGTIKVIPIQEMKDMDPWMFVTVLRPQVLPDGTMPIKLVKDGEEWKLDIASNPDFEKAVSHFKDSWKRYHTGLHSLADDLNRERYDTKAGLEGDVLGKLRAAKD